MIALRWDCHWVRRRLSLLAAGDLPLAERRRAECHLAGCAACRREGAAWSASLELLLQTALQPPGLPDRSLWPAVRKDLHAREFARPGTSALASPVPWLPLGLLTAASVLVIALSTTPATQAPQRDAERARAVAQPFPRSLPADLSGPPSWRTVNAFDLSGGSVAPPEADQSFEQ